MEHMKHSTSRDFRINANILAEQGDESSDSSGSDAEENNETVENQVYCAYQQIIGWTFILKYNYEIK